MKYKGKITISQKTNLINCNNTDFSEDIYYKEK